MLYQTEKNKYPPRNMVVSEFMNCSLIREETYILKVS